jgi:hypothetical protein
MKKLTILFALMGCAKAAPGGLAPGQAGPVTITDPQGIYQASVVEAGATQNALVTTSTVTDTPTGPYASVSQWWATAGSGTVKEAGATLYALTCTNLNSYGAWIQIFNQVTTPATDTGALAQWYIPASGEIIIGTDDLTASGISLTNGLSWGLSTVTQFYNATATSPNCNFTYK